MKTLFEFFGFLGGCLGKEFCYTIGVAWFSFIAGAGFSLGAAMMYLLLKG